MTGDRVDAQRHLGEELRTRRHAAGLTGHALAAIIGLDQSRISRIELGRLRISEFELQRWLQETSTPPEVCAQITSIAQRACGTVALWRNVPVSGGIFRQEIFPPWKGPHHELPCGKTRLFQTSFRLLPTCTGWP
ncbi:helix-turn-helix transcriptional regulator [Pseudonocardia sp. ICBG601]|uniref:helix-turn-helix domain-containing protein n=1 Tax=Pseudonocardia sp. ICBG601 TaxID=2846759 RepID=UPI001CF63B08